ncbi:hypothetical protein Dimus_039357 [Dionaea muscipula]
MLAKLLCTFGGPLQQLNQLLPAHTTIPQHDLPATTQSLTQSLRYSQSKDLGKADKLFKTPLMTCLEKGHKKNRCAWDSPNCSHNTHLSSAMHPIFKSLSSVRSLKAIHKMKLCRGRIPQDHTNRHHGPIAGEGLNVLYTDQALKVPSPFHLPHPSRTSTKLRIASLTSMRAFHPQEPRPTSTSQIARPFK